MQVILTQNVPHLGHLGDQVHVKDGYARNYLLPRGLAIASTSMNARHIQHRRRRLELMRLAAVEQAKGEADRVTAMEIVIKAKAGAGGKLFGSVTSRDVQAAFAAQGLELDRKAFILHTPAKQVGAYTATVRLHTDVKVEISFKVQGLELTAEEKAALEAAEAETKAMAERAKAAAATAAATEAAAAEAAAPAKRGKSRGAGEGSAKGDSSAKGDAAEHAPKSRAKKDKPAKE